MESRLPTQRTTDSHSTSRQYGFTIVEMLIVAPIVILVIAGFIAAIIALTGDALVVTAKSNLIHETNAAVEQLQQDARTASEFRDVSFAPPDVQSADGAGAAFDAINYPNPIGSIELGTFTIFRSYATTKNPLNTDKELVYTTSPDSGVCGTVNESDNDPLQIDIVYYIRADGTDPTLGDKFNIWRRILHNPDQTPCSGSEIWQQRSCEPGYTDTATCQVEDELLISDIYNEGATRYYADIPDRSHDSAYESELPDHGIDCIHYCPTETGPEIRDPYSRDGDGNPLVNAKNIGFELEPKLMVGGREVSYYILAYVRRLNSAPN